MKILGLHHVSINVSDVERAAHFYAAVGMEPISAISGHIRWLRMGDHELHLIPTGKPLSRGEMESDAHFAIECDDIEAVAACIAENGGELLQSPQRRPHDNSFYLFALDPDGNRFEVTQH